MSTPHNDVTRRNKLFFSFPQSRGDLGFPGDLEKRSVSLSCMHLSCREGHGSCEFVCSLCLFPSTSPTSQARLPPHPAAPAVDLHGIPAMDLHDIVVL